jgi:RNA polymerase sigma-70 factor (ECF subfamily)
MLRNSADAEDALQETFISALNGLKNFRGDATFATWLYRIAYNATLMRLRKPPDAASLDAAVEDDESATPRELADWSHDPEAALLNKETREAMDAAVASLPETLRSAFVLRDVDGLSTEETAAVLDISIEAVKVRLHRARLALRDQLSNYFSSPHVTEKERH